MSMRNLMRIVEGRLLEGADAPLFHGTTYENAVKIIQQDTIKARTGHRINKTDKNKTMGVSLSRDWRVPGAFGNVIFEVDQRLLRQSHKIVPMNYSESIPRGWAEAEEFLIGPLTDLNRYLLTIYIVRVLGKAHRPEYNEIMRHPKAVSVGPP